ncbi:MAG TPA: leucyl aminopeptidase [Terriglobales bacterium]|nr:leucyl aminopeptidase [Terriglobales bacterium]
MKTTIERRAAVQLAQLETEALVVIAAQLAAATSIDAVNAATGGAVADLFASGEFSGKALETAVLTRPAGVKAKRLVIAGRSAALGVLELWRLAGAVTRQLKGKGVHHLTVVLPDGVAAEAAAAAILNGVASANFEPDTYRSDRKPERRIDTLTLIAPESASLPALETAVREAAIVADAHLFARELANEPSNRLTPTIMGERAAAMAKAAGLECELIGEAKARELKMGAFLGVAAGSAEPPVMMVLRYKGDPANDFGSGPLLAIIGKGITFDTGGISIKPAANMEMMKFDMCGGAATLGAMQAIAALKPKINVLAVVPASENMPGGRAQKPGDVQIAMSGQSIEVLNTDAEGRMVLADAICYARQQGATHVIDSATLTGACVVALGHVNSGVFANDEAFFQLFQRALERSGEKMWRLPLDQEYADQIKGTVGDVLNTGGRWGGAITAAQFLQAFVGDTPWIHLDIAGTAWIEENKPWMPKGPTGTPTYTLIELVREMAGS